MWTPTDRQAPVRKPASDDQDGLPQATWRGAGVLWRHAAVPRRVLVVAFNYRTTIRDRGRPGQTNGALPVGAAG